MCFYIQYGVNESVKVAKKDITCYKRMHLTNRNNLRSPYQKMIYQLNKLYTIKKFSFGLYTKIIEKGFHSYSNRKKLNEFPYTSYIYVKCVIPKETEYYYNSIKKEYVSKAIMITEILN